MTKKGPIEALPKQNREGLELLFKEVLWLANELRWDRHANSTSGRLPNASREVLRDLAEHGPQTVPALARRRKNSRQNVQIVANRLERLGCVTFAPNPDHKLSELLHLTESGERMLAISMKREEKTLERLANVLSETEIQTTKNAIRRLREASGHGNEGQLVDEESNKSAQSNRPLLGKIAPDSRRKTIEHSHDEGTLPYNLL